MRSSRSSKGSEAWSLSLESLQNEWVAPFSYPSIEKHSPSTLDQYLAYIKIMNLWQSSTKLLIPRERES